MAIDYTTPLTAKERQYLLHRGRYADVERVDAAFGEESDVSLLSGDGTGPGTRQLATGEALAQRKAELLRELELIEQAEGGPVEDDEDVPPYETWKVADLDAELKRRGLPVTGDKSAKANALYVNDEQPPQ
jgi:hypothetical protein